MDMNKKAARFLAAYRRGEEIEGGLLFKKALVQARLDFSQASLFRLDIMLDQMRIKVKPDIQTFLEDTAKQNFCLMLAFYLGELISKLTNKPVNWYSYPAAVKVLPPDLGLPQAFFSQVAAIIGGNLCLPLSIIQEKLFSEQPEFTCKLYVDDFQQKITTDDQNKNLICQQFLEKLANDDDIQGGLAFKETLKHLNLDYSLESLNRIDGFLTQVKRGLNPDYHSFITKADSNNFLLFLGFYLGTTISRQARASIKWLEYQQVKAEVPELNLYFETNHACVIENRIYFPLWVITESLFAERSDNTCRSYADGILV